MKNLPGLMAGIRQLALDGELVLEQNDGVRKLYWSQGCLVYLQSEVAGEQFGNYLLRQGILDFPALSELLANDEQYRLGEKVIQWGMMNVEERDCHLRSLQEQIMIHALEHGVIDLTWHSGSMAARLSEDLHFKLEHRWFLWNAFQEANLATSVCDLLFAETAWKWEGRVNLLDSLSDLPLTPTTAYALSFLGTEPISFETFLSLSRLPEEEAARLLMSLWALGALTLTQGKLPFELPVKPEAPEGPAVDLLDFTPFPPFNPFPAFQPPPPSPVPAREVPPPAAPLPMDLQLDELPPMEQLEFIDLDRPAQGPPAPEAPKEAAPMDAATKAKKLFIKAKQLLLQDRTIEAIRALEQSVQFEAEAESAYEAWLLLGRLRMINPAWSTRSIDALQTSSRLRPKAAEPWASMGEVYFRKAFKANAIACFQRALELDPSVPIPPEVNLQELASGSPALTVGGAAGGTATDSLLTRFKAMLGRTEKP